MKDPKRRFSATVEDYDRYRPSYPPALLDWLVSRSGVDGGSAVVDLGCGTGISTRLLASRGLRVTGIDANADMLQRARAHGGPEYRLGTAEATGLPGAGADLVTVAQAFHWFETEAALAEIKRVLRPGGHACAFWNDRTVETPFLKAYESLLLERSSEYRKLAAKGDSIAAISASPSIRDLERAEFPSVQPMGREAFFGRVHSSSYVVHGVSDRAAFDAELARLFAAHAQDGRVEFRYRTVALLWRPA